MRTDILILILGCVQLPHRTTAQRSWTAIVPFHTLIPIDNGPIENRMFENDPFLFTMSPTEPPPSAAPSTAEPTESPTYAPTITPIPTAKPTRSPTGLPTIEPTVTPSISPTAAPVVPYYPPIPPPLYPDPGYFNYDYRSVSRYGPGTPQLVHINSTTFEVQFGNNWWARVSPDYYNYWQEFGDNGFGPWKGILSSHNVETNMCGNSGMQSPIDLIETPGSRCSGSHQVRSRVRFFLSSILGVTV